MSLQYLELPHHNVRLTDGSIVILMQFPELRWILHYGWYKYDDTRYQGWYFVSIPQGEIRPLRPEDMKNIKVVYSGEDDGECSRCHPHPRPFPPFPPDPEEEDERPVKFTRGLRTQLHAAILSLKTIKDREAIDKTHIPDGKIVYIAQTDSYYKFNSELFEWEPFDIVDLTDYPTIEEVDEKIASIYWDHF